MQFTVCAAIKNTLVAGSLSGGQVFEKSLAKSLHSARVEPYIFDDDMVYSVLMRPNLFKFSNYNKTCIFKYMID